MYSVHHLKPTVHKALAALKSSSRKQISYLSDMQIELRSCVEAYWRNEKERKKTMIKEPFGKGSYPAKHFTPHRDNIL